MAGDMADKSQQWIACIISNLKFLFGTENSEEILNTKFEFISLESIQGLSLQEDEALFVDEYQLLSKNMLKQVLSRLGEGGKVVLAGDPKGQTYGINRSNEGFRVLHKFVGKSEFISYVRLDNVYRSRFVEFVEKMFE
jgi:predicted ribonuclease YlaK